MVPRFIGPGAGFSNRLGCPTMPSPVRLEPGAIGRMPASLNSNPAVCPRNSRLPWGDLTGTRKSRSTLHRERVERVGSAPSEQSRFTASTSGDSTSRGPSASAGRRVRVRAKLADPTRIDEELDHRSLALGLRTAPLLHRQSNHRLIGLRVLHLEVALALQSCRRLHGEDVAPRCEAGLALVGIGDRADVGFRERPTTLAF